MLSKSRRAPSRRGFSLGEMVVVLAIIAALAAVTFPTLMNRITQARASALTQTLDGINQSIQSYRGNTGRFPRALTQLSTKPPTGALDGCAGTVPDVNLNQWRGPYSSRAFLTAGVKISDATVKDTLRRDPANITGGSYGTLFVDVVDVDSAVAARIEESFDGLPLVSPTSYTTGTVRWERAAVPPAGPVGKLSFGIPVRGC